jgi:ribosomal protein S18 acetylase RimI-like enzyme
MDCRVLGRPDLRAVLALVDADPVLNVFVASRVDAGVLDAQSPGELWGYPAEQPRSLFHVGANLVPVHTDAAARRAFAAQLGPYRPCSAIVGVREEALDLWEVLAASWPAAFGTARAVRERQPVLAADGLCPLPEDPRVRPVTVRDFESYFGAAVAMYTEELEEDPLRTNPYGYRRYVRSLVDSGRAFGIVEDGEVVFKADVGAVGHGVAQVQGVWVAPRLRGRGLAAPAMAAVTNRIVRAGRVASLYVNDFNAPALATYRRCGYTERGVFTTVLF